MQNDPVGLALRIIDDARDQIELRSTAALALPDVSLDFDRRPRRRDVAGAYAGDEAPLPRLVEQGAPIERHVP